MFQAFLLPLLPPPQAESSASSQSPPKAMEIDYDAPLPSSRRSVARSLPSCRSAMKDVRKGLVEWGSSVHATSKDVKEGEKGGLAIEIQRRVRLVAVTPTKQVMESSVGREVNYLPFIL